jgi:non-ribosomal peptide synthase protein (TIGR01720 family)
MMSGLADYSNPGQEHEVIRTILKHRIAEGDTEAIALLEHDEAILTHYLKPTTIKCQLRRVSDVIRAEGIDHIDLLKIDVQRSEVDVLRGIAPSDWAHIHQVVLEVHDKDGWGTEGRVRSISNLLEQEGFHVHAEQYGALEGTDRWGIYARKQHMISRPQLEKISLTAPRGTTQIMISELRHYAQNTLPHYMVPSGYVIMEELPLTGNGKLDRQALPEVEGSAGGGEGYKEPEGVVERILAEIWSQVLQVERVGREDNFFELGGDSILSIKVVARGQQAGLEISVQQMFQYQRLRELAEVVGEREEKKRGERERSRGSVPLTAIQEWFFEQEWEKANHFNQALLLKSREELDGERLRVAVEGVLEHHEATRLRYERRGGQWHQEYGEEHVAGFVHIDLRGLEAGEQKGVIERTARELQGSLDLERGPVARVAYFGLGEEGGGRLLWVLHHLIVDGVSWRILLEDLGRAWEQVGMAGEVLLSGTMSFQRWAEGMKEWVESEGLGEGEAEYWLELEGVKRGELPRDKKGKANTQGESETVVGELGEEETRELIRQVPRRMGVQMQEVLLAGLGNAVGSWTGGEGVLVEMEGHGRESVWGEADVSQTVGWFTTHFPLWIPVGEEGREEEHLEAVKQVVGRVPRRGIGYGLLRYIFPEEKLRERIRRLPQGEIGFNYLGQLDEALRPEGILEAAPESSGPMQDMGQRRSHTFEVVASVSGGKLQVAWSFNREWHHRQTVERLLDLYLATLRKIARACKKSRTVAFGSGSSELPLDYKDTQRLLTKVSAVPVSVRQKSIHVDQTPFRFKES